MTYFQDNSHGDFMRLMVAAFQAIRNNDKESTLEFFRKIHKLNANSDLEKTVRNAITPAALALYDGCPLAVKVSPARSHRATSTMIALANVNSKKDAVTIHLTANGDTHDWLISGIMAVPLAEEYNKEEDAVS